MQIFPKYPGIARGGLFTQASVKAQGHTFESHRIKVLGTGWKGSRLQTLGVFSSPRKKDKILFLFHIFIPSLLEKGESLTSL